MGKPKKTPKRKYTKKAVQSKPIKVDKPEHPIMPVLFPEVKNFKCSDIPLDPKKYDKKNHPALETMKLFMEAWKNADFAIMANNSNYSWQFDGHPTHTAFGWIGATFTFLELHKYTITETPNREGDAMVSFDIDAEINNNHATLKVNVLCETAPYKPDVKNGTWGVNPVSVTQIKWGAEIK